MAPRNKAKIDVEWAESLVGLRLCVPDCWWVGYNSRSLNDGKVQAFDDECQKWTIILDSDDGTEYPMAYTALYQYVDTEASTFEDFNVPADPVLGAISATVDDPQYRRKQRSCKSTTTKNTGLWSTKDKGDDGEKATAAKKPEDKEPKKKRDEETDGDPPGTSAVASDLSETGGTGSGDNELPNAAAVEDASDGGRKRKRRPEQLWVVKKRGNKRAEKQKRQDFSRFFEPGGKPKKSPGNPPPAKPTNGNGEGESPTTTTTTTTTTWHKSTAYKQKKNMYSQIKQNDWRKHQSNATICDNDGKYCQYEFCPGKFRKGVKRKRPYPTKYRCVQCSVEQGKPVYLCNNIKVIDGVQKVMLCHMKYHTQLFSEASTNGDT